MTTDGAPHIPPQPLGRPVLVGGSAVAVGLAVDSLALRHPAGFGLMAAGLLMIGAIALAPYFGARSSPSKSILLLGAGAMAFIGVRDSPTLTGLNLLLFLVAATIAIHQLSGSRLRDWAMTDYLRNVLGAYGSIALEAGQFAATDLRPIRNRLDSGQVKPVLFGLGIGLPLVVVFTGLFASADAAFADLLTQAFSGFDLPALLSHAVSVTVTAGVVIGIWRFGLADRAPKPLGGLGSSGLDRSSAATALGLLVALFAAFVGVQITYLFGGLSTLERTGLTYSEYARRGFFELVIVAALVLGVVLVFDWATHRGDSRRARLVDGLNATLVTLTLVVLASAGYRMSLYTSQFGLTELRLYTSVFMGWVGLVLVWTVFTVLRNQRRRFALGAFLAAVSMIVGLNAVNPDAVIARANLTNESVELDAAYLAQLSNDAIPAIVKYLATGDLDCPSAHELVDATLLSPAPHDWRSASVSDVRAESALAGLPDCTE